jgi:hypothetical protein
MRLDIYYKGAVCFGSFKCIYKNTNSGLALKVLNAEA